MNQVAAESEGTICILGMPRSGTTWVAKIFDSHPGTLYRHEPDSGGALDHMPIHAVAEYDGPNAIRMRTFMDELPRWRAPKVCGKQPVFSKACLPGWRGMVRRASIHFSRLASVLTRVPVLEPVNPRAAPPRIVWKSIESTGRAGLIASADPAVRVILVVRHPCGQIDSTLRGESGKRFTDERPAADDWGIFEYLLETEQARRRGLTMDIFRRTGVEERLAWRWLLFNEKAMDELEGRSNACVVRYEDLCEAPLATVEKLFEFTGMRWAEAVERFIGESTGSDDRRYYSVYRDPARAATRWREQLEPPVVDRILDLVRGSKPGSLFTDPAYGTRNGGHPECSTETV